MMDLYFYDGWDISVLVSIEKKWTSQIVLCFNAKYLHTVRYMYFEHAHDVINTFTSCILVWNACLAIYYKRSKSEMNKKKK